MFPLLNNKTLLDCDLADFTVLLHNTDYRENQYLDYKKTIAFMEIPKEQNKEREKKISAFRDDICSFANADGGYIIFGISEDNGMADELVGVDVNDADQLELDLRNKLAPIQPKVPPVVFRFIKLDNGRYLIVLRIEHDYYAPYTHIVDDKYNVFYKRDGNRNNLIRYTELRNMFVQSNTLDEEIVKFREKRISELRKTGDQRYHRFMLFHMIPESFLSERKQLFVLERQRHQSFRAVFTGTGLDSNSIPCVDGLRYVNAYGDEEAILYNNGIAEFILPLNNYLTNTESGLFFCNDKIWNCIENVVQGYQTVIPDLFGNQRYFGCICIIGCKYAISECADYPKMNTEIDREELVCHPVAFMNIIDKDSFYSDLKNLHLEYYLAIGIRRNDKFRGLIAGIEE